MREWLAKKFRVIILFLAFFASLFFCPDGILDYINLRLNIAARNVTIKNLERENAALERVLEGLKTDDSRLEEFARRQGFIRDGEKLCVVVEK